MPIFEYGGLKIQVDDDGFIDNPEDWNNDIAKALGSTEDIEDFSNDHWKVINYLRSYFIEHGVAPFIRLLCKETGFTLKQIYELFPSGPAKGACKVAGLPKPTGCV
jgi:TusE/DsrC/DsvC family sulfur relay protein